jgi:hypothetical protein
MTLWAATGLVLALNAGSSTWASRARNTDSPGYHALAASFSHGMWFLSQLLMLGNIVDVARRAAWTEAAILGLFYTFSCVAGSVAAHVVEMRFKRG